MSKTISLAVLAILLLAVVPPGQSTDIYRYVDAHGGIHFSQQMPPGDQVFQHLDSECLGPQWGCVPHKALQGWDTTRLNWQIYGQEIHRAASRYGLDEALVRAVIHVESSYNSKAVSSSGAVGLMQLMPAMRRKHKVFNPFNPEQNIDGGVAELAHLLKRYNGDRKMALAAYNAGQTAVASHRGIPPFEETKNYLARVELLYKRYAQSRPSPRQTHS